MVVDGEVGVEENEVKCVLPLTHYAHASIESIYS